MGVAGPAGGAGRAGKGPKTGATRAVTICDRPRSLIRYSGLSNDAYDGDPITGH